MVEIGLIDLPKSVWAIDHPAQPSPTSLDQIGADNEARGHVLSSDLTSFWPRKVEIEEVQDSLG